MGYVMGGMDIGRYRYGYLSGLDGTDETVTYDRLFNKIWEKTIGKVLGYIPGVGDMISSIGKGIAKTELKKYIQKEAGITAQDAKSLGTDTIADAVSTMIVDEMSKDEGFLMNTLQSFGYDPNTIGSVEEIMATVMAVLKEPIHDALLKGINKAVEELFGLEAQVEPGESLDTDTGIHSAGPIQASGHIVVGQQSYKPKDTGYRTGGKIPTVAIAGGLGIAALIYFLA